MQFSARRSSLVARRSSLVTRHTSPHSTFSDSRIEQQQQEVTCDVHNHDQQRNLIERNIVLQIERSRDCIESLRQAALPISNQSLPLLILSPSPPSLCHSHFPPLQLYIAAHTSASQVSLRDVWAAVDLHVRGGARGNIGVSGSKFFWFQLCVVYTLRC